MKLLALRFLVGNPPLPGFRELGKGQYEHWRAHVRGPSVFLVSPPGWQLSRPASGTQRQVHEVPRVSCALTWEIEDGEDLGNTGKWSPEPSVDDIARGIAAKNGATGGKPDRIAIHPDNVNLALDAGLEVVVIPESSQPAAGAAPSVTAPAAAPRRGRPPKAKEGS